MEGAPEADVEQLQAAADGKQRQASFERTLAERQFPRVPVPFGAGPSHGAGPTPYSRGSTSGPPLRTKPSTASSTSVALELKGGSRTGQPPAYATAST